MSTQIKVTGNLGSGAYMAEYKEPEHVIVRVIGRGLFPYWDYVSAWNKSASETFGSLDVETKSDRLQKYYDLCYKLWYGQYVKSDEFKFKDPDISAFCNYQIEFEKENYNKAKDDYKKYFDSEFESHKRIYIEFINSLEAKKVWNTDMR